VRFKCSVCNYSCEDKSMMTRHINRKTRCGEGDPEIIEIPTNISCEICKKKFG
jgi:hypothetical protein